MKKKSRNEHISVAKKTSRSFVIKIIVITFFVSLIFAFFTSVTLNYVNTIISILIVLFFIIVGILSDIIGIACATADEKIFHSMAARGVKSAKIAVKLIKNAEKVSNISSDMIGDISGIISGSASAVLTLQLTDYISNNYLKIAVPFLVTAAVASITVGGKAIGKIISINGSNSIIYRFSAFLALFGVKD